MYEDFPGPICLEFETAASADIAKLVTAGTVKVHYHMIAILDDRSEGNRYSSRALNAAICASDISTAAFQAYHGVLYGKDSKGKQNQPEENSNGRTDAQLEAYFKLALPKATSDQTSEFEGCVSAEQHAALAAAMTDRASRNQVTGTPTILINGKKWSVPANDAVVATSLVSAINAAKAK